jgi:hypothetical protein
MIKILFCKLTFKYLLRYDNNNLFERECFTAEEVGQILGGN